MTPPRPTPLRPRALRPGDRVAVVAPGGPIDRSRLDAGLALLRSWDLDPVVMPHVCDRRGYLAGSDADRLADVTAAWADPRVRGIVCARGGYGCQRIVDDFDLDLVTADPKVFCGFSDVTALHLALGRTGLVTFHGPMAAWNADRTGTIAAAALRRALCDPTPLGVVRTRPGTVTTALAPGRVTAPLVGGNLTLLAASAGTRDAVDARGRLLLLEEVGEAPYRVDRLLRQLRRSGALDDVAGIVVGECVGCDAASPDDIPLAEVLADALGDLGVPVSYGLPLGHGPEQVTVPLGVAATLDADAGTLDLIEPATRP